MRIDISCNFRDNPRNFVVELEDDMPFFSWRLWVLFVSSFAFSLSYADDYWNGEAYAENSDLQTTWALSYLEQLQLKGDEAVLDIGCGDGRSTAAIARAIPNGHVVGVDSSDSMIQRALCLQGENLSFEKRNAMDLGFEQEFDLVLSFNCLHWVPDFFAAMQGIKNSLKPGGKALLFFGPDYGEDRFDHAVDSVAYSEKWQDHFRDFSNGFFMITPAHLLVIAEKTNLFLNHMKIIAVDETFPNREAFIEWVKGWMPHLKRLPVERHQEFLEEVMDCYLEKHPIDIEGRPHFIDYFMEVQFTS